MQKQSRTCAQCGTLFVPKTTGKGRGKFCSFPCAAKGRQYKSSHGHTRTNGGKNLTPIYAAWLAMRQRCSNPRNPKYSDYGGRGIRVCDRWNVFENFLADMGERPEGMTLDRINNDGNYEPGNCRWADRLTQQGNTRWARNVEYNGKTQTILQWSKETGIHSTLIGWRLSHGWTVAQALTTKPKRGNRLHGLPE